MHKHLNRHSISSTCVTNKRAPAYTLDKSSTSRKCASNIAIYM